MVVSIHVDMKKDVRATVPRKIYRGSVNEMFAANTISGELTGQSYCQKFYKPNNPIEIFRKLSYSLKNRSKIKFLSKTIIRNTTDSLKDKRVFG